MFVRSIEYTSANGFQLNSPNWEMVETYLRSIDGHSKDGVLLEVSETSYMGISGGEENQFVVAGYSGGFGSFILASGRVGEGLKNVAVCGDYNKYESQYVVGLEQVIAAAKELFEHGELAKQLRWENQKDSKMPLP